MRAEMEGEGFVAASRTLWAMGLTKLGLFIRSFRLCVYLLGPLLHAE